MRDQETEVRSLADKLAAARENNRFADRRIAELVNAPVSALAGVSDADAEALKKAFNIKTIGDLATNKFIRAATAIAEISAIAK